MLDCLSSPAKTACLFLAFLFPSCCSSLLLLLLPFLLILSYASFSAINQRVNLLQRIQASRYNVNGEKMALNGARIDAHTGPSSELTEVIGESSTE